MRLVKPKEIYHILYNISLLKTLKSLTLLSKLFSLSLELL